MANVFLAAALLSSILAVSGCAGLIPGLEALGSGGGGGYPSSGGAQGYPYDPGAGGGYAQPGQPYYQSQPYAYSGNPGAYAYQSAQPVPQPSQGYIAAPSGRWIDRRQQLQEDRIRQGLASGQLTPREARRLQNEQGRIRGAEGRMRANGNLNPQERARLNAMQNRSSQDIYRQRHNGVQQGSMVQSPANGASTANGAIATSGATPSRSPRLRTATRPRANGGGRPARNDGSTP